MCYRTPNTFSALSVNVLLSTSNERSNEINASALREAIVTLPEVALTFAPSISISVW